MVLVESIDTQNRMTVNIPQRDFQESGRLGEDIQLIKLYLSMR